VGAAWFSGHRREGSDRNRPQLLNAQLRLTCVRGATKNPKTWTSWVRYKILRALLYSLFYSTSKWITCDGIHPQGRYSIYSKLIVKWIE
jgi:hypothetical protein